jgi:glycosyltransferase involved in cell wall biosynthesis
MTSPKIIVIIPAYNEAQSIGLVLAEIPSVVSEVIVVNNRSTDETAAVAKKAGATVLTENQMGYGHACLKGMDYVAGLEVTPDIVVFLDGDYSDYPKELLDLVAPIIEEDLDFVVGARQKALREAGSMTPQQVFGNALACTLMKLFFGATFTDLGPFRAIKYKRLLDMKMSDTTYGWTVEMQLKALRNRLKYKEIGVKYKKRIGVSKVSGTVKGTIFAGVKILGWIFKYSFK